MNLLTKPRVKWSLFLWILQMGKWSCSSATRQNTAHYRSARASPACIKGSKWLVWHDGEKTCWCSAENGDLDWASSRPSKQSWSARVCLVFSLRLYSGSTAAAATARQPRFGTGRSLPPAASCKTGQRKQNWLQWRAGGLVFPSLAKPMRRLQEPLLNLVQGRSTSRGRETEARGREKKIKGKKQTAARRWPSGCLGLLAVGGLPGATSSLFSLIESWARP